MTAKQIVIVAISVFINNILKLVDFFTFVLHTVILSAQTLVFLFTLVIAEICFSIFVTSPLSNSHAIVSGSFLSKNKCTAFNWVKIISYEREQLVVSNKPSSYYRSK